VDRQGQLLAKTLKSPAKLDLARPPRPRGTSGRMLARQGTPGVILFKNWRPSWRPTEARWLSLRGLKMRR
jgi:hypothetical protein